MDNRNTIEGAYDAFLRGSAEDFAQVLQSDSSWEDFEDFPNALADEDDDLPF